MGTDSYCISLDTGHMATYEEDGENFGEPQFVLRVQPLRIEMDPWNKELRGAIAIPVRRIPFDIV